MKTNRFVIILFSCCRMCPGCVGDFVNYCILLLTQRQAIRAEKCIAFVSPNVPWMCRWHFVATRDLIYEDLMPKGT